MHDRHDDGTDDQSDHRRRRRVDQPAQHGVADRLLEVVHETIGRVPTELVGPDEQYVAADPEHRDGTDDRERGKQLGHACHQAAADALREP